MTSVGKRPSLSSEVENAGLGNKCICEHADIWNPYGDDGDEEYVFSGSDDELGMEDLDDDDLSGSEYDDSMHGTESASLPADDEQPGSLPGPSTLQSPELESPPLPAPQTQSCRGRAPRSRPPRGRAPRSRPPRGRAPQSRPPRGRVQSSRPAEEERSSEWSSEPSDVIVQPFTMEVGPTFPMSADPMEVFYQFNHGRRMLRR